MIEVHMGQRTYDHLTRLSETERKARLEQSRQYARDNGATVVEKKGETIITWPDATPQAIIEGFDRILGIPQSEAS